MTRANCYWDRMRRLGSDQKIRSAAGEKLRRSQHRLADARPNGAMFPRLSNRAKTAFMAENLDRDRPSSAKVDHAFVGRCIVCISESGLRTVND